MWHILGIGLFMGIMAAAVPGPINLEVVRRALVRGPRVGFAFGMGAVTADILFVIASSVGALALFSALPKSGQAMMWLIGSVLLLLVGISALRAKVKEEKRPLTDETQELSTIEIVGPVYGIRRIVRNYFLGLALTLSSPPTIMYWIFTMVGFTRFTADAERPELVPWLLAAGVGTTCTLWVAGVATIAGSFHRKIQPATYLLVERIGGAALCGFAFYSLYKAIRIIMG